MRKYYLILLLFQQHLARSQMLKYKIKRHGSHQNLLGSLQIRKNSDYYKQLMDNTAELVSCPFNASHKMKEDKLKYHIGRCRDKKMVGHLYTICQFNANHIILKDDLVNHYNTCQDKVRRLEILRDMDIIKMECKDVFKQKQEPQFILENIELPPPPIDDAIPPQQPKVQKSQEVQILQELYQCQLCRKRLTDYFDSKNRSAQIDKILTKFNRLGADLLKLQEEE